MLASSTASCCTLLSFAPIDLVVARVVVLPSRVLADCGEPGGSRATAWCVVVLLVAFCQVGISLLVGCCEHVVCLGELAGHCCNGVLLRLHGSGVSLSQTGTVLSHGRTAFLKRGDLLIGFPELMSGGA